MKKVSVCGKFVCIAVVGYVSAAFTADLVGVLPVTDKILMVYFDEGHIDYPGIGENRYEGAVCYWGFLDINAATTPANYSVSSTDDDAFAAPVAPVAIGRKSKGTEFNNIYQSPSEPMHLCDHFVYIELPQALQTGKSYSVTLNGLAENTNKFSFVFDEKQLRSETVHVNQIGYVPSATKYAYLSHHMGDFSSGVHQAGGLELDEYAASEFHVVRVSDNAVVYSGPIAKRKDKSTTETSSDDYGPEKNFTKADVWECDFSEFATPGEYRIAVDGIGCSWPFSIHADAYREAFYTVMRGLFFQRSGIVREIEPGVVYERDFHPDDVNFFYDATMTNDPGDWNDFQTTTPVDGIWGWYHDAGDWDTYCLSHATVPALLLLLFDLAPQKFADGDVGNRYKLSPTDNEWVDEGVNGIPDILDEGGWYVQFLRRAREAVATAGGTGGVPGYVGRDATLDGVPSWDDPRDVMVTAEDENVTAVYAGLAAWYGALLVEAGRPQAEGDDWIADARDAYTWATGHGASGGALRFAQAALYRGTGDAQYQTAYESSYDAGYNGQAWAGPSWDQLAACVYLTVPADQPGLSATHRTTVKDRVVESADSYWVDYSLQNRGYRATHIAPWQTFMLGAFSTPRMHMVLSAYMATGEQTYLDAARFAADYCLGGNEMNMVWVSGLGDRFDRQPFHPDSWYLKDFNSMVYTNPILPGLVAYGGYRSPDWFGAGWSFIGDEDYSRSTAYPVIENNNSTFPMAEARFENRYNIPGSEFTIHQNSNHAILTYGFLCGDAPQSYEPNVRPTVSLPIAENTSISMNGPFPLTAQTSADAARVKYYYDWHFIGESADKAANFAFPWDLRDYGVSVDQTILLTAVAYDDRGMISEPSDDGDRVCIVADIPVAGVVSPKTVRPRLTWRAARNTVALASGSVVVLDAQGRVVIRRGFSSEPRVIELGSLPRGMYTVVASFGAESAVRRVTVL